MASLNAAGVVLAWVGYFIAAYYLTGKINHAALHAFPIILVSLMLMLVFKGDRYTFWHATPTVVGLGLGTMLIALKLFEPTMLSLWTVPFLLGAFTMFSVGKRSRTAKDIGV